MRSGDFADATHVVRVEEIPRCVLHRLPSPIVAADVLAKSLSDNGDLEDIWSPIRRPDAQPRIDRVWGGVDLLGFTNAFGEGFLGAVVGAARCEAEVLEVVCVKVVCDVQP